MRKSLKRSRALRAAAGAFSVLCLAAGLTMTAQGAWAAWVDVPDNGETGLLELYADPYPLRTLDLSPGAVNEWQIRASLTQDSSQATMYFAREGTLVSRADAMQVLVQLCSQEWNMSVSPATCSGTLTHLIGPIPASDPLLGPLTPMDDAVTTATPLDLGIVTANDFAYVLATVWIDDAPGNSNDSALMGQTADFGFAFTAAYDDDAPTPSAAVNSAGPGDLASTGFNALVFSLLCLGALGLGATLRTAGPPATARRDASGATL